MFRRSVAPALSVVVVVAIVLALFTGSRYGTATTFVLWVAVAGAAYLGMLAAHRQWSGLTPAGVVTAAAGLAVAAVAVPPRTTGDLWMYAAYGRMAARRLDPWTQVPALLPRDDLTRMAGHRWMHTPSMYGPAMVWIERVLALFAGHSVLLTRLEYQLLALAAIAASAAIVWRRTRSAGALAFLLVNPAVVLYLVNGGRNDALVGLALLVAAVLTADGHDALPGVVSALAVLVKLTAGIGVVALVAWLAVHRGRAPAARAAAAATAVVVGGTVLAGSDSLMVPFRRAGRIVSHGSAWELVSRLHLGTPPSRVAVVVAALLTVVVLLRHLRGRPALAFAAALAAWTLALPYLLAGYLGWSLPTAALERRSRVGAVLAVDSVALAVGYSAVRNPAHGWSDPLAHLAVLAMPVVALVGLLVLLVERPDRRGGRAIRGGSAQPASTPAAKPGVVGWSGWSRSATSSGESWSRAGSTPSPASTATGAARPARRTSAATRFVRWCRPSSSSTSAGSATT